MDKREARSILGERLREYRQRSYIELQQLLTTQETGEVFGDSGTVYQLEFLAVWDDKPGSDLRILASIDVGGIRALLPIDRRLYHRSRR